MENLQRKKEVYWEHLKAEDCPKQKNKYRQFNKELKTIVKKAKKDWLEIENEELEQHFQKVMWEGVVGQVFPITPSGIMALWTILNDCSSYQGGMAQWSEPVGLSFRFRTVWPSSQSQ